MKNNKLIDKMINDLEDKMIKDYTIILDSLDPYAPIPLLNSILQTRRHNPYSILDHIKINSAYNVLRRN